MKPLTYVTDCASEGARLATRLSRLGFTTVVEPVAADPNTSSIAAGFRLIELLDAADIEGGSNGVIAVNVAPRNGKARAEGENGASFVYFRYGPTLVVATRSGYTLSFVKKLGLVDRVFELNITDVLSWAVEKGLLAKEKVPHIVASQFRGLEFLPRVVAWLEQDGCDLPAVEVTLDSVPDVPVGTIAKIDNHGNAKIAALPEEIGHEPGKETETAVDIFTCYAQLRDVPDNEYGITVGSSGMFVRNGAGIVNRRFVELVRNGGEAAQDFRLAVGRNILEGVGR